MADPQTEDGYTRIANSIVEALMRVNLSACESRVLWFLFRKTYGWGKKTDWITLSQFSKCIVIDRRLIHRAIKKLSSKNMIVIQKDDRGKIRYGFQKNYEEWRLSSKKMTVIYRDDAPSSKQMTRLSSKQIHTKETLTKEILTKEISSSGIEFQLAEFLFSKIKERNPKHRKPDLRKWARVVDLMIRKDHRSPEDIRAVIDWCQNDEFWSSNILSTDKLRTHFDKLYMRMNGSGRGQSRRVARYNEPGKQYRAPDFEG